MILGISQRKLKIAVIVQSEMPAISQAAHSKSDMKYKSSGTYQPIMSNPVISTLISKRHVIWWVCPILRYSRPSPSNRSTFFLWLSWHSFLPIFFVLASEGLATPGRPCGQASQMDPWQLTWEMIEVWDLRAWEEVKNKSCESEHERSRLYSIHVCEFYTSYATIYQSS